MIAPSHTLLTAGCALLLCVGGCSHYSGQGKVTILDGCMVEITGISTLQAQDIIKTWDIDPNCQVEVNTNLED